MVTAFVKNARSWLIEILNQATSSELRKTLQATFNNNFTIKMKSYVHYNINWQNVHYYVVLFGLYHTVDFPESSNNKPVRFPTVTSCDQPSQRAASNIDCPKITVQ